MAARNEWKQRPRKPNQTGRDDKTARFVMLPHRVLESAAYASLSAWAKLLLTELVAIFDGDNNGSIYLSADDATNRLGLADKKPVLRAFSQLEEVGLIELTKPAHFDVKTGETSRARCWRLAWLVWPESPNRSRRTPMYDWEQYQASGKRADKRLKALAKYRRAKARGKFPGVEFTPLEANWRSKRTGTGENFTPEIGSNGANASPSVGVDFTPYLDITIGRACGWWGGEAETRATTLLLQSLVLQGHAHSAQDQPHRWPGNGGRDARAA